MLDVSPTQYLQATKFHRSKSLKIVDFICLILRTGNRLQAVYLNYVGHLESKERLRIQPAQLFNFS